MVWKVSRGRYQSKRLEAANHALQPPAMRNPFRYFNSSPDVVHLAVMVYIRYPLSLGQIEDIMFERGIDIGHKTMRFWWNRFGPMFAAEIRTLANRCLRVSVCCSKRRQTPPTSMGTPGERVVAPNEVVNHARPRALTISRACGATSANAMDRPRS